MRIAAEQVAILYIIVAVGVLADKTNLFTEKTARLCTGLLFYIITPAVIVRSFLEIEYDRETAKGLFIAIGCGLLFARVCPHETEAPARRSAKARVQLAPDDDYDEKLTALLDQVKADDDARQQFVDILELMGPHDPRTAAYRRKLTARLY